jgi:hypothetical protein
VVGHRLGCFALRARIRLGLLLRELTRMYDDKTERFIRDASSTVLDLAPAHHTLPMPAAGQLVLGAPRFLQHEGQCRLRTPPGFEFLTHGAGARD